MFPVLFEFAGYKIHAYGFFIALGYLASLTLLLFLARKRGDNTSALLDLAFIGIVTGVVGARILFIAINHKYYKQFPMEALYVWKGGLVFYGGLLFAIPCCALYIWLRRLPLWPTLDLMAPALAIGHSFGRIGCLGAGCCHGSACELPWAIRLNTDLVDPILRNVPLHPTQIYEAVSLAALSGGLVYLILKRKAPSGVVTICYLMSYAVIRSVVEIFRGDHIRGFLIESWLSTSQFISLGFFLLGGVLLWRRLRRND